MNPGYQVNLPPVYPQPGVAISSSVGLPGIYSPLAYTHGLYSPVNPTISLQGSLSANGALAGPQPGQGLMYESASTPLMRPYGKSIPYAPPATRTSYPTALNASPAQTQSAYSHSLSQTGNMMYSTQSAYPPSLPMHHGLAPPSSMMQPQPRQLYLPNGSQQAINPALGLSPAALAARGSPMHHTIPVNPAQSYQYAMMAAAPPNAAGTIYPTPTYYASYAPVYQGNGAIP